MFEIDILVWSYNQRWRWFIPYDHIIFIVVPKSVVAFVSIRPSNLQKKHENTCSKRELKFVLWVLWNIRKKRVSNWQFSIVCKDFIYVPVTTTRIIFNHLYRYIILNILKVFQANIGNKWHDLQMNTRIENCEDCVTCV